MGIARTGSNPVGSVRYKTLLIYSNKKQLYSYNNSITIRTTEIDIVFNFGVSNTCIECLCVKVIYLCSLYRLFLRY